MHQIFTLILMLALQRLLNDGMFDASGEVLIPRELPRGCISVISELGNGAYGTVFKVTL